MVCLLTLILINKSHQLISILNYSIEENLQDQIQCFNKKNGCLLIYYESLDALILNVG